ncbi:MAG: CBS domain-containing protein [Myxococcaceae bacterium]|nr:CBS domain-containing protein [Myxococcaceae bacterium]
MRAEALMTVDVTCVDPGTPLSFVWTVMNEMKVRHLPVLEGEQLRGILSHRDLMLHGQPDDRGKLAFPDLTAAQVMATKLHTCTPAATVSQVADLMVRHKVGAIPVVQPGGELVGLVTSTDLLKLLIDPEATEQSLPFTWALHRRDR